MPCEAIRVQECHYEDKVHFHRKRLVGTYQHAINPLALVKNQNNTHTFNNSIKHSTSFHLSSVSLRESIFARALITSKLIYKFIDSLEIALDMVIYNSHPRSMYRLQLPRPRQHGKSRGPTNLHIEKQSLWY